MIKSGKSPINQIKNERIQNVINKKIFSLTTDFKEVKNLNAIILCVPTPLNSEKKPDLSYVINSLNSLLPFLENGQLLSLEKAPLTQEQLMKSLSL